MTSTHDKHLSSICSEQIQAASNSDNSDVKVLLKRVRSMEIQIDKLNSEITTETTNAEQM